MARRYVNPAHQPTSGSGPRGIYRIRGRAELERLMDRDPGPWTIIRTADLENLIGSAESAEVASAWPELAALLREGLR